MCRGTSSRRRYDSALSRYASNGKGYYSRGAWPNAADVATDGVCIIARNLPRYLRATSRRLYRTAISAWRTHQAAWIRSRKAARRSPQRPSMAARQWCTKTADPAGRAHDRHRGGSRTSLTAMSTGPFGRGQKCQTISHRPVGTRGAKKPACSQRVWRTKIFGEPWSRSQTNMASSRVRRGAGAQTPNAPTHLSKVT